MVDLATIATGTKILSGLSGIFGKKKNDVRTQTRLGIRGTFDEARYQGVHPLALMGGGGAGYSGPISGSNDQAGGLARISEALSEASDRKTNSKLDSKQSELIDAQIAEARSRTLLNSANARRSLVGPSNNPTGVAGGVETVRRSAGGTDPGSSGKDRGVRREGTPDLPARQRVSFGNRTYTGPNPEAFEVGLGELIASALIYGPQAVYDEIGQMTRVERGPPKPTYPRPTQRPKRKGKRGDRRR